MSHEDASEIDEKSKLLVNDLKWDERVSRHLRVKIAN